MTAPTEEGKKRFPPNGFYCGDFSDNPEWWEPCTCKRECPDPCKGSCGCKACGTEYSDYLSSSSASI